MVNVYGLHLADGTVRRVRSLGQWKMSDAGKPTLFTASIAEVQSRLHTAVEDEFIERMIDLRFLAERAEDDRYRQIVDRCCARSGRTAARSDAGRRCCDQAAFFRVAMSITKRYFTSLFSMRA